MKVETISNQKGSALIAMALVLIVSSSFVLVSKLNANTQKIVRQSSSLAALNEAKAALIGYAVTYPDKVNANAGPGYLPCPDLDNDGDAEGGCALAGPTNFTIGRFPFESLEVKDLRDAGGERLWYALSDKYRNFAGFTPLNSDTAGELNVDGFADIVAVIIAPNVPVAGQNRPVDPLDKANYLEDDNADGDVNYVTRAAGDFNDTVVTITRQELMRAVELRVLGEVSQTLTAYQTSYFAFPWLTPFADPSASAFRGQATTVQGHIPFHWAGDTSGVSGRNPFTSASNVSLAWSVTGGTTAVTDGTTSYNTWPSDPPFTPTEACVTGTPCNDAIFGPISALQITGPSCTWSDKDTATCTSTATNTFTTPYTYPYVQATAYGWPSGCSPPCFGWVQYNGVWESDGYKLANGWATQWLAPRTGTMTRTYEVAFGATAVTNRITVNFIDSDGVAIGDINAPLFTELRTRDLNYGDTYASLSPLTITITDTLTADPPYAARPAQIMSRTITGGTDITIDVAGIQYDIDVDDGELPSWFVSNNWQDLVYVSYASGEPLPGNTTVGQDCVTLTTNCLTVDADSLVIPNIRAVAVSAGVDLTPGTTRPNGTLTDYFENDNFDADDAFTKNKITAANNDQTRIIATAP